jgi:hypothetical protein
MTYNPRDTCRTMEDYLSRVEQPNDYDKDLFSRAQTSKKDEERADFIIAREKKRLRKLAMEWDREKERGLARQRPSQTTPGKIRQYDINLWPHMGD